MTIEEAKELCIRKWEYIVENDGILDSYDLEDKIPELKDCEANCAYCELYSLSGCEECPINLGVTYDIELSCRQLNHPFLIWANNQNKGNAQKVLDLIKNSPL